MRDLFHEPCGEFRPTAGLGARVMSDSRQAAKLRMIARLDRGEITGWLKARTYDKRSWFPGEMEALGDRAKELGMRL